MLQDKIYFKIHPMPNIITETAQLQCDKGSTPARLKVSSQNFSFAGNKLVATENDKVANSNIMPFGVCSITKAACMPTVLKWENTAKKDTINDLKVLLETSTCKCTIGGNIKVIYKGHSILSEIND